MPIELEIPEPNLCPAEVTASTYTSEVIPSTYSSETLTPNYTSEESGGEMGLEVAGEKAHKVGKVTARKVIILEERKCVGGFPGSNESSVEKMYVSL